MLHNLFFTLFVALLFDVAENFQDYLTFFCCFSLKKVTCSFIFFSTIIIFVATYSKCSCY